MSRIIFWLVVVFALLFVVRLVNAGKSRRRPATPTRDSAATAMVRCTGCGVFLPRADAHPVAAGFHCGRPDCTRAAARSK